MKVLTYRDTSIDLRIVRPIGGLTTSMKDRFYSLWMNNFKKISLPHSNQQS